MSESPQGPRRSSAGGDFSSSDQETGRQLLAALNTAGRVASILRSPEFRSLLATYLLKLCSLPEMVYERVLEDAVAFRAIELVDQLWSSPPATLERYTGWTYRVPESAPLYLALLLRGIGTAGGWLAEQEIELAAGICQSLEMPFKASSQVRMLLRHYTLLSHLSQRRDLSDRRVAQAAAAVVGDVESLCMLCIVNYAVDAAMDRRGWTEWKNALLWELYEKIRDELLGGYYDPKTQAARLKENRARVLEYLQSGSHPGLNPSTHPAPEQGAVSSEVAERWLDEHLAMLPERYPLDMSPELVATQILMAQNALLTGASVEVAPVDGEEGYTRLLICCKDVPGLFARVTGTLATLNVNIVAARLETRKDGIVVDVLWISTLQSAAITDAKKLSEVKTQLETVLRSRSPLQALLPRLAGGSIVPLQAPPQIRLSNDISGSHTVLEIIAEDRVALACTIAACLTALGLNIRSAKLSTHRMMVYDVFYFTELTGAKLAQTRWDEVTTALKSALITSATGVTD